MLCPKQPIKQFCPICYQPGQEEEMVELEVVLLCICQKYLTIPMNKLNLYRNPIMSFCFCII